MTTSRNARYVSAALAALVLAGTGVWLSQACADDNDRSHADRTQLIGSWLVHDPNNANFAALPTFTSDGLVVISTATDQVSDAHGVWVSQDSDECDFVATWLHLRRNSSGQFIGSVKQHACVLFNGGPNSFTAQVREEVFDASGNLLATDTGTRAGTRILPEPF